MDLFNGFVIKKNHVTSIWRGLLVGHDVEMNLYFGEFSDNEPNIHTQRFLHVDCS